MRRSESELYLPTENNPTVGLPTTNIRLPSLPKMLVFRPLAASSRFTILLVLPIIACCIFSALSIKTTFSASIDLDPYNCAALQNEGHWSRDTPGPKNPAEQGRWQPSGCVLHDYASQDIKNCLRHRAIIFAGDSAARRIFWATAIRVNAVKARELEASVQKHCDMRFDDGGASLQFIWDPYLNPSPGSSSPYLDLTSPSPENTNASNIVVFSSGLWYAKHLGAKYLSAYKSQMQSSIDAISRGVLIDISNAKLPPAYRLQANHVPIFLPVIQPDLDPSNQNRSSTMTAARINPMNDFLETLAASGQIELFQSFRKMAREHPFAFAPDKLHVSDHLASIQANVLLNYICNAEAGLQKVPYDKTCCNVAYGNHKNANRSIAFSIFIFISMVSLRHRWGSRIYQKCRDNRVVASSTILAMVVIYCFAADRSSLLEKANKPINMPAFTLLLIFGLISGVACSERSAPGEILPSEKHAITPLRNEESLLSRQQSDEWKGWMQLVILLYHYFGMSRVLWAYQIARLLVCSYLFMTGFGHTMYFLKTNDFSLHRIATVLLRLNMLSWALSYVMLSSYDFYYFSMLCSFWFVVVFCTLGMGQSRDISTAGFIIRCLASMICVDSLIHLHGVLETVSNILLVLFRIELNAREFRFRAGLDMYIVYVGVAVGWLYHKRHDATFYSWLDSHRQLARILHWSTRNAVSADAILKGLCMAILTVYLLVISCFADKYQYNKLHPYVSPIFVLAYLALRNSSTKLRASHSPLFAWLGRCSLETYILQCHIWLAGDAKGLLRLGLFNKSGVGDVIESMLITVFFLWTSWHASKATSALTAAMLRSRMSISARSLALGVMGFSVALVALNWTMDLLSRKS